MERYCPKTAENQIELRRKFANFLVPKNADPIPKLFELEDLVQLMRNAGIEVDAQTVLGTFISALSYECYHFGIRELSRKQVFDRDEIINLIEAQWNLPQKRRSKSSPAAYALIADRRGGVGVVDTLAVSEGVVEVGEAAVTTETSRSPTPGTTAQRTTRDRPRGRHVATAVTDAISPATAP